MLQLTRRILAASLALSATLVYGASDSYTTPGTYTWTVPAWITSTTAVTVESWGGGGAGGGATSNPGKGGGGAGGQYARKVVTGLTAGSTVSLTVGAGGTGSNGDGTAGGDTIFGSNVVVAKGGGGGRVGASAGAAGAGSAANGVGDLVYAGGSGSVGAVGGACNNGGAGGGGAGSTGPGGSATGNVAGTGTANNGGNGGAGTNSRSDGNPGSAAGGGGGGACAENNTDRAGGAGGPGRLVITYPNAPVPPTATTNAASSITTNSATLNGTVVANDATATVSFEYGTTASYGGTLAATPASVPAGTASVAVSAAVSGLSASTTYHFRVKASSSAGTVYGADQTFTTLSLLSKTASASSALLGDVMTFTISVSNPDATARANVSVVDTLPAGMSYSAAAPTLGSVAVSGQQVTWTIPSLPGNGSATLTLAVSLTQQGALTNTVTATGFGTASASVLVLPSAVTHFRLDEPVGSWTGATGEVLDTGTTGLNGTRLTTTTPTTTNTVAPNPTIASQHASVVGGFCNAASFDGRAVVQVADSPLFDYTTKLSASAWIYPTAYPTSDLYSILSNDVNYEFHLDPQGKLFWWWNSSNLTSATTIPLNQWTHVAITFDSVTGRQRIYINGVQDANTNNWKGTLQANNCNFYIGGDITTGAACSLIPARNFRGMIDEVKLYSYELSAAEVQADMTLGRSCSGTYDHIQIEHDGSGSVCTPETVTVKACLNASCSTLYTGAVTVRLSPTGWAGGDTFSFSGGVTTRQLSVSTAGNVTLGTVSASPIPAGGARCFIGSTESCTMTFANASCNFDAAEVGGSPQSRLYTKLSGTAFNVDVLALSSASTVNTTYTGTVAVDLVDSSASTCPSGSGLTSASSVTFASADQGRKQVTFNYANAAPNVRVRMKAGSSAAACSTDNFAIRPQQFTVSAPVLNNTGLTGAPKAVAGSNFALDADASVAGGYSGTAPVLNAAKALDHNGATIASGTLSGTFGNGDGAKASGSAFRYLDVGNLQFSTDAVVDDKFTLVDQAMGDCTSGSTSNTLSTGRYGCNIGSAATGRFGRWVPSHYSFSGALTAGCSAGGFTYMDQDALGVALTVKAHASTGAAPSASDPVVSRYTSGYTNLAGVTISGDNNGAAVDVNRFASPAFPSMPSTALWSAGVFQLNETYAFTKLAAPDGPYDQFKLKAAVNDTDGATLIGTAAEQETGTTRIRYGRLRLQNAYGSELLALPLGLSAQYWQGAYFATHTLDSCTALPAGSITMGNYQGNLSACETHISPATNLVFANGLSSLTLSRPGAGNSGSVDLSVNEGTAAAGKTCLSTTETNAVGGNVPWFSPNLGARAAFGLYKAPLIYMRENY